ncbi:MAG: hypothetical protein CLLPBCKN_007833 [Chroococcidiopsis cubana SAG 39.79]|nr:hypothetical protein [Chroococcidiopsis cubana SAG 39.79]
MLHATFAFSIPGISYQLSVKRERTSARAESRENILISLKFSLSKIYESRTKLRDLLDVKADNSSP